MQGAAAKLVVQRAAPTMLASRPAVSGSFSDPAQRAAAAVAALSCQACASPCSRGWHAGARRLQSIRWLGVAADCLLRGAGVGCARRSPRPSPDQHGWPASHEPHQLGRLFRHTLLLLSALHRQLLEVVGEHLRRRAGQGQAGGRPSKAAAGQAFRIPEGSCLGSVRGDPVYMQGWPAWWAGPLLATLLGRNPLARVMAHLPRRRAVGRPRWVPPLASPPSAPTCSETSSVMMISLLMEEEVL